ncbi:putative AGC [Tripterygium wilfordii]|uniref:non-specific serine/threonine protein kinase n=1 Tax=Tripterygium wilfordii TaxID=458696 RepID=A0A7J7D4Q5_TRIWF|nr:serine/threonine-protein kinase OXI1-like [Tripterygium wilfordii]KAF5741303.1 putative AGC [Tripterygium wilfordii]
MNDDEEQKLDIQELKLERVKVISVLGRGAKGVVFLVRDNETGELWAMKAISRHFVEEKIHDGRSEYRRVCFEQRVLSSFDHLLLPRLHRVLVTDKIVGYAIDYCPGRDLNYLRKKQSEKMFADDLIRFYAAEMVLALEYLHNQGIVYRDLKPENIMIQENGHIMLVDFDLSTKLSSKSGQSSPNHSSVNTTPDSPRQKHLSVHCNSVISPGDSTSCSGRSSNYSARADWDLAEKSNSFVGTEEYVAPEIILGNGHDFAVDWWSLGVVLYEMLYGTTPFRGSNRNDTFSRILKKQPDLVGEATPLRDLIRKLLEKDPKQRIGLDRIKGHDFFRRVDWDRVVEISRPPYIPLDDEVEEQGGDTDGIHQIDVELFVQGLFAGDVVENIKVNDKITDNHETETFLVF